MTTNEDILLGLAKVTRAASRKKFYALRAEKQGQADLAKLLRAIAASEEIQARRLLNTIRGQLDLSDTFLQTIFSVELNEVTEAYGNIIKKGQEKANSTVETVANQLRAAERRNMTFYNNDSGKIQTSSKGSYQVCEFCGYVNSAAELPPGCPICGATPQAFTEVS